MSTSPWLSVFDLDHTLISINSSLQFTKYLVKKSRLSKKSLFCVFILYCIYKIFPMLVPYLHHLAFRAVFRGKDVGELSLYAEEFWVEKLDESLSQELVKKLASAKEQGHYTALLSNSPDFFVQMVAKKMGFDFCRGSLYHKKDNKLDKIAVIMGGEEKAKTLHEICERENIPISHTSAYTDCLSDLPLLEAVAKPFAVNPSQKLKKHCKQKNWGIILTR